MSNNYVEMNRIIHGAVRRDLDRIVAVTQEPLDPERRRALQRRVERLVQALRHHHTKEDELIWPAALSRDLQLHALSDAMELEHREIDEACDELVRATAAYAVDDSENHRQAVATTAAQARATIGPHFEHEETEMVPRLVRLFDRREWRHIERGFKRGISISDVGWLTMWLMDDLPSQDLAFIDTQLPPPLVRWFDRRYGGEYDREAGTAWGALAGVRAGRVGAG